MNKSKLKYTDSHDHSLGIVGMAIGLYAFDCSEYLVGISLKDGQQDFVLSDDFINPPINLSNPAEAIELQVEHFKVYSGLLFSNYFCRRFVAGRTPNITDIQLLEKHLCGIASAQMGIDEAHAHQIARNVQQSFRQLYSENMLCSAARNLAADLRDKLEMTREEVDDRISSIFN